MAKDAETRVDSFEGERRATRAAEIEVNSVEEREERGGAEGGGGSEELCFVAI